MSQQWVDPIPACADVNDVQRRFYQVPSLQDLFKTVKPEVILDFLKAAALYRFLWGAYDCFKHSPAFQ